MNISELLKRILRISTTNSNEIDAQSKAIEFYVKDISGILDIPYPDIRFVHFLYRTYSDDSGWSPIVAQLDSEKEKLPANPSFLGAYYDDTYNTIFISLNHMVYDSKHNQMSFISLTGADCIYILAHELRHVWQFNYEKEKYYSSNAIDMEAIQDESEIDADAFALAYVFSDKTSVSHKDLKANLQQIHLQGTLDNGKRWDKAKDLKTLYGLSGMDKLNDVRDAIDTDCINRMILLMTFSRQFYFGSKADLPKN